MTKKKMIEEVEKVEVDLEATSLSLIMGVASDALKRVADRVGMDVFVSFTPKTKITVLPVKNKKRKKTAR